MTSTCYLVPALLLLAAFLPAQKATITEARVLETVPW